MLVSKTYGNTSSSRSDLAMICSINRFEQISLIFSSFAPGLADNPRTSGRLPLSELL